MKEQIDKVIAGFRSVGELTGETDDFTKAAQQIAVIALGSMNGSLLHKALAISEAIVGFSEELGHPNP